jgi:hypothetical protein
MLMSICKGGITAEHGLGSLKYLEFIRTEPTFCCVQNFHYRSSQESQTTSMIKRGAIQRTGPSDVADGRADSDAAGCWSKIGPTLKLID